MVSAGLTAKVVDSFLIMQVTLMVMLRITRIFLVIALLTISVAGFSQEASPITNEAREAALSSLKKWRNFEGTWEGEVRYLAAPKEEWFKQRMSFRVTVHNNQPKVFIQRSVREWSELATTYRIHQPDELTLVIHCYGSGGVWTENNIVVLTRRTEDIAEMFIQRVVNNWAGKVADGEDLVYGDTRGGKVMRKR